jgi:hypothetical protein
MLIGTRKSGKLIAAAGSHQTNQHSQVSHRHGRAYLRQYYVSCSGSATRRRWLLLLRVGGWATASPPAPGRRPDDDGSSCSRARISGSQVLLLARVSPAVPGILLRVGGRETTAPPAPGRRPGNDESSCWRDRWIWATGKCPPGVGACEWFCCLSRWIAQHGGNFL